MIIGNLDRETMSGRCWFTVGNDVLSVLMFPTFIGTVQHPLDAGERHRLVAIRAGRLGARIHAQPLDRRPPGLTLRGFLPGFEPGSTRVHIKHGIAAAAGAVLMFGLSWYAGRSRAYGSGNGYTASCRAHPA
jgi:hypothetical protein